MKPAQLSRADLTRMTPPQIDEARLAGRLDDMLGIARHWPPTTDQWTHADLAAMARENRHDEINDAREAGQLTDLINNP